VFAVAKVGFGALFVALGMDVNGAALGLISAYLFSVLLGVTVLLRPTRVLPANIVHVSHKPDIGYLGLSAVALSAVSILFFSDVVILRKMISGGLVDSFAAAKIVGLIFIYAPLPLIASLFPKVTERQCRGESPFPLFWKSIALAVGGFAVALVAWWFIAPLAEPYMGGGKYPDIGKISRLYCLAVTPYALANILVQFSVARGRWRFLIVLVPAALAHLALVFFFGPNVYHVITAVGVFGCAVTVLIFLLVITDKSLAGK